MVCWPTLYAAQEASLPDAIRRMWHITELACFTRTFLVHAFLLSVEELPQGNSATSLRNTEFLCIFIFSLI